MDARLRCEIFCNALGVDLINRNHFNISLYNSSGKELAVMYRNPCKYTHLFGVSFIFLRFLNIDTLREFLLKPVLFNGLVLDIKENSTDDIDRSFKFRMVVDTRYEDDLRLIPMVMPKHAIVDWNDVPNQDSKVYRDLVYLYKENKKILGIKTSQDKKWLKTLRIHRWE